MKIKFSIKIQLLKMQRTGYFIAKKKIYETKMSFTNKFEHTTHITFNLHFSFLTFNSILNHKNIQLGYNLSSIAPRIKLKIFKNLTITNYSEI
jgi:hypothetical protein